MRQAGMTLIRLSFLLLFGLTSLATTARAVSGVERDAVEFVRASQQRAADAWARRPAGVMPYFAVTAAGVIASATDPVQLIFGAVALTLGWLRRSVLSLLALTLSYSGVKLAVLFEWWQEIGLAETWATNAAWMTWINGLFLFIFYALGRVAARVCSVRSGSSQS